MVKKVIGKISKIISGVIYIMIVVAIGVTLIPFVAGFRPVVVLSGSMEPTYPVGSMIYYRASNFENIDVGDAITFRLGGEALATHRVIKKDDINREFVTKGDNNQTEDVQPVAYENVVGKTSNVAIYYVGFIGIYIRKTPVIIGIGALLIVCAIVRPKDKKARRNTCEE